MIIMLDIWLTKNQPLGIALFGMNFMTWEVKKEIKIGGKIILEDLKIK